MITAQDDTGEAEVNVDEWLAIRKDAALKIVPETAEVRWFYVNTLDPYGVYPELREDRYRQVGRDYFACAPGSDIWVWFGDLPRDVSDKLWETHKGVLAFPAGLPFFG